MKTTIHYNTEHPEVYKHAMNDIKEYLGADRFTRTYNAFLADFNPCTWTLETFHFYLGWYGIEGFPVRAFAWSIIETWEATH